MHSTIRNANVVSATCPKRLAARARQAISASETINSRVNGKHFSSRKTITFPNHKFLLMLSHSYEYTCYERGGKRNTSDRSFAPISRELKKPKTEIYHFLFSCLSFRHLFSAAMCVFVFGAGVCCVDVPSTAALHQMTPHISPGGG